MKCNFYNEVFCEPCKSPTNFNDCPLVKIGHQIIVDKFVESIPESKKSEYVSLEFYLNNLKNQREKLISDIINDLKEPHSREGLINKWQGVLEK